MGEGDVDIEIADAEQRRGKLRFDEPATKTEMESERKTADTRVRSDGLIRNSAVACIYIYSISAHTSKVLLVSKECVLGMFDENYLYVEKETALLIATA